MLFLALIFGSLLHFRTGQCAQSQSRLFLKPIYHPLLSVIWPSPSVYCRAIVDPYIPYRSIRATRLSSAQKRDWGMQKSIPSWRLRAKPIRSNRQMGCFKRDQHGRDIPWCDAVQQWHLEVERLECDQPIWGAVSIHSRDQIFCCWVFHAVIFGAEESSI